MWFAKTTNVHYTRKGTLLKSSIRSEHVFFAAPWVNPNALISGITKRALTKADAAPPPPQAPVATVPKAATSPEWTGFDWKAQWYPLAFSKTTDLTGPSRIELLGKPLVLWYDHFNDKWAVMADECPHRLAPLSEGRVDEEGEFFYSVSATVNVTVYTVTVCQSGCGCTQRHSACECVHRGRVNLTATVYTVRQCGIVTVQQ